jgi:hypothetical protein
VGESGARGWSVLRTLRKGEMTFAGVDLAAAGVTIFLRRDIGSGPTSKKAK